MKKIGIISLIIYVIIALLSGFTAIMFRLELDALAQNSEDGFAGWAGVGIVILMIYCMIACVVAVIATICKLLHVIKGWGFFGFLCTALDVVVVGYIGYLLISSLPFSFENLASSWPILVFWGAMIVSLCANIASFKE